MQMSGLHVNLLGRISHDVQHKPPKNCPVYIIEGLEGIQKGFEMILGRRTSKTPNIVTVIHYSRHT